MTIGFDNGPSCHSRNTQSFLLHSVDLCHCLPHLVHLPIIVTSMLHLPCLVSVLLTTEDIAYFCHRSNCRLQYNSLFCHSLLSLCDPSWRLLLYIATLLLSSSYYNSSCHLTRAVGQLALCTVGWNLSPDCGKRIFSVHDITSNMKRGFNLG